MNGTDLRRDFRYGNAGELEDTGGMEMAKQGTVLEHPLPDAAFSGRIRAFGALTMIGGAILTVGAILIDLGWFVDLPAIASLGNALSAISGLGLLFLPIGLRASRIGGTGILATAGTVSLVIGICLASIVDLPAILDPTDLEAGGAIGPIGLLLLSIGFLAWFVAIRRAGGLAGWRLYTFLAAGLWFLLTFPTVQLPLFVIPNGRPSFILLAGVLGMLQLIIGMVVLERAYDGKRFTADTLNDA
jgi:hypothetical protein